MNILLVEDELKMSEYLTKSFESEGHHVETCVDFESLENLLTLPSDFSPEVIVLDRLLKNQDASESIPRLKKKWDQSKIVVLSAIGSSLEKSRLLDLGVDDYVSKPFSIEELHARIRAVARRKKESSQTFVMVGDVLLNLLHQSVEVSGKRLDLSRKEYLILSALMQAPGRVYSKYQLLDMIWNVNSDVDSNVVEVTVKNLRRKLGDAQSSLKIMNRRQVGYWVEI